LHRRAHKPAGKTSAIKNAMKYPAVESTL